MKTYFANDIWLNPNDPASTHKLYLAAEVDARIAELEKALRGFALQFVSRNGISVERAVIRGDSPDVIEAKRLLGL